MQTGPEYAALTAAGQFATSIGLVDRLTVGPFAHREMLFDESEMNMLGLYYLSRYTVTLDFPSKVAYFRMGKRFSKPELRGTSGITLHRENGKLTVQSVRPGGPAETAGLVPGDQVVWIQNEAASSVDMFRARELLTSDPGHPVHMTLLRADQQFEATFRVKDRLTR